MPHLQYCPVSFEHVSTCTVTRSSPKHPKCSLSLSLFHVTQTAKQTR